MNDIFYSGTKPNVFPNEREANNPEHARELCTTTHFWWINHLSDYSNFNFEFVPLWYQMEQRHAWPSQHQKDGGTYLIPKNGYVDTNYRKDGVVIPRVKSDWGDNRNFDFTWHPDPTDPPLIYQFGTQHQKTGGPQYIVLGATDVKYMDSPKEQKTVVDDYWDILENVNKDSFDWTWHPDDTDPPYIYVFGNQWFPSEIMPTVEYHVPGATDRKYVDVIVKLADDPENIKNWTIPAGLNVDKFDFNWRPPKYPPFIYQFGTQWQKTGGPRYVVPGATEIKYVSSPRAIKKNRDCLLNPDKDNYWLVPKGLAMESSSFDWSWHPDSNDPPYIYQFGTQWQKTGGPQYIVPGATAIKFIDQVKIEIKALSTGIYEIDHYDGNSGKIPNTIKKVRYVDNYLDTLIRIAVNSKDDHKFIWICSSICDYTNFDFTWHPEDWQQQMLHVFPSDGEKFGDTFFMNVPLFLKKIVYCDLLENYDLNFTNINVPRRQLPIVKHDFDTHVDAIKTLEWDGPLAIFTTNEEPAIVPPVVMWSSDTKNIIQLSKGASEIIVPKISVPYIKKQVYDYPLIDKTHNAMCGDQLLDIVFVSNGEHTANKHWDYLNYIIGFTGKQNRLHRSDGVKGRAESYRAAAELSTTPWFFAVFAKLEVDPTFDWSWQPDRLQESKHYIFHAQNPVNGLVYGHQAMIAYNKKLVLENTAHGLDFTLDQEHEVVPIMSGIAHYTESPWMAWRTAFRECIKLKASLPNDENEQRLIAWLSKDNTDGKWSIKGAEDAIEYYDNVSGDFAELKKSYEWEWLANYALVKRNLTPNQ